MLILTRKPGESLFIGESVKITVMEIKGNQIRIGIDAPRELRIYREEIYLQIIEENKMASDVSAAGSLGPIAFAGGSANSGDNDDSDNEKQGLGKLVVKPVSGLNSMKGRFANKDNSTETKSEAFNISQFKNPEVVVRKKKKPSEEA